MLESLKRRPGSLRWPPRQRFVATEQGRTALETYQEAITRYQAGGSLDRDALERVQREWAAGQGIEATDAVVLGETTGKERLPREIQVALADCGVTLPEVQAAIDRLFLAGLLMAKGGGGPLGPPQAAGEE
jgi:hypothetical protein